jgi:hypothetical protein
MSKAIELTWDDYFIGDMIFRHKEESKLLAYHFVFENLVGGF